MICRTHSLALALLACVLPCATAAGAPFLYATTTDLGDGLVAYDVFIDGGHPIPSISAVDLKFSGMIHQVPTETLSLTVNTLAEMETLAVLGPDPVRDSYIYAGRAPSLGISGGNSTLLPSAVHDHPAGFGIYGTETIGESMWAAFSPKDRSEKHLVTRIAHIVIQDQGDGAPLTVAGDLAYFGDMTNDYSITFSMPLPNPEPHSALLLGLGATLLVPVRRRRRQPER